MHLQLIDSIKVNQAIRSRISVWRFQKESFYLTRLHQHLHNRYQS